MNIDALANRIFKLKKLTIGLLLLSFFAIYKFGTVIGEIAYFVFN